MNMREPGARQAFSDTSSCSSSASFFSFSAANVRYAVISLVSDAGSKRSSALSAARIWPLVTSATTQARPTTCGGWGVCAITSIGTARPSERKKRSIGRFAAEKAANYSGYLPAITASISRRALPAST